VPVFIALSAIYLDRLHSHEKRMLALPCSSFCLSARPSEYVTAGRKFYTGDFYENLSRNTKFGKNRKKNIGHSITLVTATYVRDEGRECLLLFSAESFVFQFAIQKVKDQDIQN